MRRIQGFLSIAALAVAQMASSGCSTKPCKPGTLFLAYNLPPAAVSADSMDVALSVDGGAYRKMSLMRTRQKATGSIEIDFDAYPEAKSLDLIVTARIGASSVATVTASTTAIKGCTQLSLDLNVVDMSLLDMSTSDMSTSDMSISDMSISDMPSPDFSAPSDLAVPQFSSCVGLAKTCGPNGNGDCCECPLVTGAVFKRSYDVGSDNAYTDGAYPATVSDFRFDRYEVTVGRFRVFVGAGMGTQANPPGAGAGAHPMIAGSGWDTVWNTNLAVDKPTLLTLIGTNGTWTDTPAANEDRPISQLNWYEAMAFCAWDGGYLPTEAQWNYAAAAGTEQRAYPWSSPASSLTIDNTYAVYNSITTIKLVGSDSPKGDGKWGQSDLAGNVSEWTLDWLGSSYANPCIDCANLTPATNRAFRGGSWFDTAASVRSGNRSGNTPGFRNYNLGVRCARGK